MRRRRWQSTSRSWYGAEISSEHPTAYTIHCVHQVLHVLFRPVFGEAGAGKARAILGTEQKLRVSTQIFQCK